ncbi:MAG: hypothetical protein LBU23_13465, partial [Planctomycetota bacterium]|nr:hypothetical protein [Planctomycetota bacterium]
WRPEGDRYVLAFHGGTVLPHIQKRAARHSLGHSVVLYLLGTYDMVVLQVALPAIWLNTPAFPPRPVP